MTIITVYAMFSNDIRYLSTNKNGDPGFYAVNCIVLTIFTIEIILNIISQVDYFLSFNFFLDVISTCSIILDIGWITNLIYPTDIGSGASA